MRPRFVALTLCSALLAGCAGTPPIDHQYSAKSQESRVRFLIMHYTVSDFPISLKTLTEDNVSSHYLLRADPPEVYGLVDDQRLAHHAGVSYWQGWTNLNYSSVGIEIVNPGYVDTPEGRQWAPYSPAQIEQLILLAKKIIERHQIRPENVLGHSDIAPQRKSDPGPLFPWKQLAEAGIGRWPDEAKVQVAKPKYERALPTINWFQKKLAEVGYQVGETGELDPATRNVLIAFQMHFRPQRFDGELDAETAALLSVLTTPGG